MRRAFLIILICLVWAGSVNAQRPSRGFFTGRVVAGGIPVPNAFVHLEAFDGQHMHTVFTDAKGSFRFDELTVTGDHLFVVVEEDGFEPFREQVDVATTLGGAIVVYLIPEEGPDQASTGRGVDRSDVVDVRQLGRQVPEAAWDAYDAGLRESDQGHPIEAVGHLERALALAPDFYEARIKLGGQYVALGRGREAEAAYRLAMESNPSGALAPLNLGILYYEEAERARDAENEPEARTKLRQAKDSLDQAVRLNPVSPEARFYLGAVLHRMGDYALAEQMLLFSLELDEANQDQARLMLINVYTRLGRLDEALEQISIFVEDNPDSPQRPAIEQIRSQIEAALER